MNQSPLSETQLGMTVAAVGGDSGLLYRLAAGLLDDGVPFDVLLFDILLRLERDVGMRWQSGDYLVSEEHAATATVETVVALLAGSFDWPESGSYVVVATSEGDDHSLPARAVAAHLLYRGYRAVYLGANVLASDLRDFLESERPEAVVLSCAMTTHLLGARATVQESHGAGVPVLGGGRGFGDGGTWAPSIGTDAWTESGRAVAQLLANWQPDVAAAEASARNPDESLRRVLDRRNAVLAAVEEELSGVLGGSAGTRLRNEAALAFDAAAAAMLVGDRRLLDDFLSWQNETLTAQGIARQAMIASALSAALRPLAREVAGWLAAAR